MSVSEVLESIKNSIEDDGSLNQLQFWVWVQNSKNVIETILAILAVIVILSMTTIIAMEVLYINFPLLHDKIDDKIEKNKGLEKVFNLVLKDAHLALLRADTQDTGRSANFEYIKIKWKIILITIIAVTLALSYSIIIRLVANILSYFIKAYA